MIVIHGNNIEKLKEFPDNHFDAVVTDPPYGLGKEPNAVELMKDWVEKGYHEISGSGFMGKEWDAFVPQPNFWKEVFRVLKHGGHVLSFFGTRTYDWGVMAMRFAGFEVRDCIQWLYGSGFPKSHNVSKAIDKQGGESLKWFIEYVIEYAEKKGISKKELTMLFPSKNGNPTGWLWNKQNNQSITLEQYNTIKDFLKLPFQTLEEAKGELLGKSKAGLTKGNIAKFSGEEEFDIYAPATKQAKQWDGWGSSLKPANEPIVLARKPLEKGLSIAENVLKWGTGGINIDGCRVGNSGARNNGSTKGTEGSNSIGYYKPMEKIDYGMGRFPANLILTHANYQVMNLVGNIDICTLAEIIQYFYGYTKVSDLRERKRSATKQDKCRDEVLQSEMQEAISQKEYNPEQSSSELSELSNSIYSDERALSNGEEKVLQSPLQRPTSEINEGGESNKIWQEAYGGIQEENGGNQDKEWNNTIERKASELERGENESSWICEHNDFNTTDGLARNGEDNATKSNIHIGTQNSDGDGIKKTIVGFGECSSYQRDKERQSSEEFSDRGQNKSFKDTQINRCRNGSIKEREPILEVLDFDVPAEWLQYFEYTGENLGCECKGLKKDGNGEETVEHWECVDDCPIKIMDEQSGISKSNDTKRNRNTLGSFGMPNDETNEYSDKGGASRFFYVAKASKSERNRGLDGFQEKTSGSLNFRNPSSSGRNENAPSVEAMGGLTQPNKNFHPTVKPVKLMQYLVRLITPPNGKVLDPFCGSGTTGIACKLEGFEFIGIEQDSEYCKIAQARIENYIEQPEEELKLIAEQGQEQNKTTQLSIF